MSSSHGISMKPGMHLKVSSMAEVLKVLVRWICGKRHELLTTLIVGDTCQSCSLQSLRLSSLAQERPSVQAQGEIARLLYLLLLQFQLIHIPIAPQKLPLCESRLRTSRPNHKCTRQGGLFLISIALLSRREANDCNLPSSIGTATKPAA